ncbi:MAG: hypothetical protein WEB60_15020 [Terrimicrobiaceae bacterium]
MKTDIEYRRHSNPLHIAPLFRWLILAAVMGTSGLIFVYVKNQQHQLGVKTREVERQIVEEKALNEVLLARISSLSSRAELMRKLQQGFIVLRPIQDHAIARLTPPARAGAEGLSRTAANESFVR